MDSIGSVVVGIICIALGISHRKGNLSLLHSYHKKRVAEEDLLPFGKLVGLGTIIIGAVLILSGILFFLTLRKLHLIDKDIEEMSKAEKKGENTDEE